MHRYDISTIRDNEYFLFFFSKWHKGSNVVSIIYYADRHPWGCCVTAQAAVYLLRSEMNCRQGRKS